MPAYGDGEHLLAEGSDEPADEVKEEIPVSEDRIGISYPGQGGHIERVRRWPNFHRG